MLRSLRARLLLAILGVAALSLALAGWLFSRVTVVRFEEYVGNEQRNPTKQVDASVGRDLEEFYGQHQNWNGVEPLLAGAQEKTGERFVVTDSERKVLAVSARELRDASIIIGADQSIDLSTSGPGTERVRLKGAVPLPLNGDAGIVGLLYRLPAGPSQKAGGLLPHGEQKWNPDLPGGASFPESVNRGLIGVIALVLAVAGVATFWLARRIVAPVELLTAAVEKIRSGDLQQKVPADSRDEIGELGRAFNAMSEQLARVEKLRRDMVSDVAHELRTPLTNIRAQIEAIQDGLAQPGAAVIASLHEEALHLGRLVDDLRDLSLADAGQLRIERVPLAPAAALEQAIQAVQPRAAERGIAIERNYNGTLPDVLADPVRLGQILRNLLENAIRHTPQGGSIFLSAARKDIRVEFSVRDSGPGIAAEHLPNIFERFYRTDPSRARETGGAGLGLAIVKQLVAAHGGTVSAQSAPGAGATFLFSLPIPEK